VDCTLHCQRPGWILCLCSRRPGWTSSDFIAGGKPLPLNSREVQEFNNQMTHKFQTESLEHCTICGRSFKWTPPPPLRQYDKLGNLRDMERNLVYYFAKICSISADLSKGLRKLWACPGNWRLQKHDRLCPTKHF